MVDLKGKAAVVTGSARGIGYAIADRLAELGADIIINDINDDAAKKAAEEIASKRGVKTGHFAGDISQQEPAEKLIDGRRGRRGRHAAGALLLQDLVHPVVRIR